MLKVGLTGNRYSGKDKICELFNSISIPVFDADTCINYLLCHNFEFTTRVQKKMSNFSDIGNNSINTSALDYSIDIIQDEIFNLYEKYCKKNKQSAYVIFKSSILFERGWNQKFNFVINVFAPINSRIERCKNETGLSYSEIYEYANSEILDEQKNISSDFVIHNYKGNTDIFKSVNEIDTKIIDLYLESQK